MKSIVLLLLMTTYGIGSVIKIAVAANVSYAMEELIKEFHKQHPNVKVKVTLGSSGKLTAQIYHGAPFDIFLSADMKYPAYLYKSAMAITKPRVYAQGSLAYLTRLKIDWSQGAHVLENRMIKKIALANPKTAPYGKAAVEVMKNSKLYEKVSSKFIYAESVSQTVVYTLSAADIGFVAKSSLYSPKMAQYKKGVNWVDVNTSRYTPIAQGIVILKGGKSNKDVRVFYDFIFSKEAQNILYAYGYRLP